MPGNDTSIEGVLGAGNVSKADMKAHEDGTQIAVYADAAALRLVNATPQPAAFISALRTLWRRDPTDTTSADDGVSVIVDGNGNRWKVIAFTGVPASANGAAIDFAILEEEVTVSGATTDTTIQIPDRGIVFAVSTRVTEAITGATSFDIGDGTTVDLFGGTLALTLGSTNSGVIGPKPYYAATAVRLTANGSNFTGGKVRVAIQHMLCPAPTG